MPPGLPDRIVCVAGAGLGFHGFKGRPWAATPGNLHLSVHLAPDCPIDGFHIAFTALAAVSVVEAIDGVPGVENRARIKWVNDVLLGEGKVAGTLAYTQSRDTTVSSAVLGIGVNVENTPHVEPTPFVPSATSLREAVPDGLEDLQQRVFLNLLSALDRNYRILLAEGLERLIERYRGRAVGWGRRSRFARRTRRESLRVLASGRLIALGEKLELHIEGRPEPITGGRLILGESALDKEPAREGSIDGAFARIDSGAGVASGASTIPEKPTPN